MSPVTFSWTVIAATGERFRGFSPYVASVDDAGTVAFQAALPGEGSGVFTGSGGEVVEAVGPDRVGSVTSHPDLNGSGAVTFYGGLPDGGQAVFLQDGSGLRTIAAAGEGFTAIGPLGPTISEAGTVAFRADRTAEVSGVFTGDGETVVTIAETGDRWGAFHGLPVILDSGEVVFRADRSDGVQGIYLCDGSSTRVVAETGEMFETLAFFPTVDDRGTVAFAATLTSGGGGIFTAGEGQVTSIVEDGAFEAFRGALVTGAGEVLFIATPRGGHMGIFAGPDPDGDRMVVVDDALFGSVVTDLAANPVSVSHAGQVAVRVTLADDRQLVLRADR